MTPFLCLFEKQSFTHQKVFPIVRNFKSRKRFQIGTLLFIIYPFYHIVHGIKCYCILSSEHYTSLYETFIKALFCQSPKKSLSTPHRLFFRSHLTKTTPQSIEMQSSQQLPDSKDVFCLSLPTQMSLSKQTPKSSNWYSIS